MNLVVWLVAGGSMGCVASLLLHPDPGRRVATQMVVGISGALVGGWLVSPFFGGSTADQVEFSGVALLVSVAGAAMFLAISHFARGVPAR